MATKRPDNLLAETIVLAYEHGALTADTTVKLWEVPAGRQFRLDKVWYNNPTGLAADAANYFNLKILKDDGVTPAVMANWSTETGQEGALTADTPVSFTKAADAAGALVADAGEFLSVFFDETGTQTLPAGRVVIEGRLL